MDHSTIIIIIMASGAGISIITTTIIREPLHPKKGGDKEKAMLMGLERGLAKWVYGLNTG